MLPENSPSINNSSANNYCWLCFPSGVNKSVDGWIFPGSADSPPSADAGKELADALTGLCWMRSGSHVPVSSFPWQTLEFAAVSLSGAVKRGPTSPLFFPDPAWFRSLHPRCLQNPSPLIFKPDLSVVMPWRCPRIHLQVAYFHWWTRDLRSSDPLPQTFSFFWSQIHLEKGAFVMWAGMFASLELRGRSDLLRRVLPSSPGFQVSRPVIPEWCCQLSSACIWYLQSHSKACGSTYVTAFWACVCTCSGVPGGSPLCSSLTWPTCEL